MRVGVVSIEADAARLGGGESVGRQSSNVTQREATPPAAPATPARRRRPPTTRGRQAGAGSAGRRRAPKRPWGGMLGGLAAGLGLAWLAQRSRPKDDVTDVAIRVIGGSNYANARAGNGVNVDDADLLDEFPYLHAVGRSWSSVRQPLSDVTARSPDREVTCSRSNGMT